MKKVFYILLALSLSRLALGQSNLVPNYSFEIYDTCPQNISTTTSLNIIVDEVKHAIPWKMATSLGTSDYFNACVSSFNVGIPQNIFGFQPPRTGVAYTGLCAKSHANPPYREYICAPLISPLASGVTYYASMFVSLSANNSFFSPSNRIGMYFSVGYPDTTYSSSYLINKIPQIENPPGHILSDTLNWIKISGKFIAAGGENYITIGNFSSDASTNSTNQSYFYIDDVSLSKDSLHGYQITDIKTIPYSSKALLFYPNPTPGQISIQVTDLEKIESVKVSDKSGKTVFTKVHFTSTDLDLRELSDGFYFIEILYYDKIYNDKIVIQH